MATPNDDPHVRGDRRERVGAGDKCEGRRDKDGGSESDVFPLLPRRALLKGLGAGAGEPEEKALHAGGRTRVRRVHGVRIFGMRRVFQ